MTEVTFPRASCKKHCKFFDRYLRYPISKASKCKVKQIISSMEQRQDEPSYWHVWFWRSPSNSRHPETFCINLRHITGTSSASSFNSRWFKSMGFKGNTWESEEWKWRDISNEYVSLKFNFPSQRYWDGWWYTSQFRLHERSGAEWLMLCLRLNQVKWELSGADPVMPACSDINAAAQCKLSTQNVPMHWVSSTRCCCLFVFRIIQKVMDGFKDRSW